MFELNGICNTIEQDSALLGSVCENTQTLGLSELLLFIIFHFYIIFITLIKMN